MYQPSPDDYLAAILKALQRIEKLVAVIFGLMLAFFGAQLLGMG